MLQKNNTFDGRVVLQTGESSGITFWGGSVYVNFAVSVGFLYMFQFLPTGQRDAHTVKTK